MSDQVTHVSRLPIPCGQTNPCENITFSRTTYMVGNIKEFNNYGILLFHNLQSYCCLLNLTTGAGGGGGGGGEGAKIRDMCQ